jgi:AAA+ ATPase superfamily predicted ATPase
MIIQKFKDRKSELKELSEVLNSNKFEFLIVYGRRRVGKTELVLEATKNMKRLYYLSVGEKNLERFYSLCQKHYPEVSRLKMDWEILFDFLKTKVEVIIIDEFQNLIKEDKNNLNTFQSIVDIILKDSRLKLILVASVSMMTSQLLSYKSPLYGRRTASIELKPVSFFDIKEFFPHLNIEQLIEIYGFADGIPSYLVKVDKDLWSWLDEEMKRKSFLRDEADFIMRYEFEDVSTYKLILEAIAFRKTKLAEIKDYIKVKRTDITSYLKNLLEVKMIKRVVPVTESIKSRLGRYYLSDNFLKFWFRYIYPNLSAIEEGIFDARYIKQDYNTYLGDVFEEIARQFLIRSKIFPYTKIGKWWYKDKETDIVALNEQTKQILFAECKWKDEVDAKKVLQKLKEKSQLVQWNNEKRKEYYALFAKSFKKKIEEPNVFLFDLKDLEKNLA